MAASFVFGSFFLPAHVKEALEALPPAVLFLLQACPMETITVGRSSTHSKTLVARQGGHVAVWEFSIQALDIGFQVEFEGDAVTEYELVKSTKADPTPTVRGRFKCPHKGKVVLKWDNSFSMYVPPPHRLVCTRSVRLTVSLCVTVRESGCDRRLSWLEPRSSARRL